MIGTVTIDKAGRVVLPKALRDELRLEAGDSLEVELEGDRVSLRPIRANSPFKKERGVWVFQGGGRLSADEATELIRRARESRDAATGGKKR